MEKRRDSGLAAIAMLVLLLIVAASLISIFASRPAQAGTAAEPAPLSGYWTEDSVPAQKLRDYVAKVTDPNDTANYIPEKDRIAVFDMDGMLTCETYYTYYDTMMFIEFCLYDHPERVSDELKQVAASIKPGYTADEALAMNYTIDSRNPYPAEAYMVVADDNVREWGTQDWEKKSSEYSAKGYVPISMKDDFAQIYADDITRAEEQYHAYAPEEEQYQNAA